MGWQIGFDSTWDRDIGYGVPAMCDHPGCEEKIDRGLSYVCGGEPYGEPHGCGLFFCSDHLSMAGVRDEDAPGGRREDEIAQQCERCSADPPRYEPFEPKPDVEEWVKHKLTDASWEAWRTTTDEGRALVAAGARHA